jgi:hypothetical protein
MFLGTEYISSACAELTFPPATQAMADKATSALVPCRQYMPFHFQKGQIKNTNVDTLKTYGITTFYSSWLLSAHGHSIALRHTACSYIF